MPALMSLALLSSFPSLAAAGPEVPASEWAHEAKYNRFIKDWLTRLQKLEEMLRTPDAKTANKVERLSSHLYREMIARVVEGEGAAELFGRVLFCEAVAEARLGDLDAAAWRWQEVQSLQSDAEASLTNRSPDVADRLKGWLVDRDRWGKAPWIGQPGSSATDGQTAAASGSEAFVPPKIAKKILPDYSKDLIYLRRGGDVVVEFVVGKTGSRVGHYSRRAVAWPPSM